MCLAIPSKVVELKNNHMALVEISGITKEISVQLVPNVKVGDYVIVHVGYALSIMDHDEADKSLELLNEIPR